MLPKDPKLNTANRYEIYKHYKQSLTSILNDQLHYKTHTLFDTISHASLTNISATLTTVNQKVIFIAASSTGPPSFENGAQGTEKLLLSEDFA